MGTEPDFKTLDIVQQALKTIVIALAGATKADMSTLSTALAAGAQHPGLLPEAKAMLADLAQGTAVMAKIVAPPTADH